jgi:hypothetical protein
VEVEVVGRAEGQQLLWGSGARAEEGKKYEAGRGVPSLNSHAPNEEQADGPGGCRVGYLAECTRCCVQLPHRWHGPTPILNAAPRAAAARPCQTATCCGPLLEPLTKWSHDGSRSGTGHPRKLVRRRNGRRFAGGIFERVSRSLRWHNWASFLVWVFESSAQQQRSTTARPEPKPTGQTVQPSSPAASIHFAAPITTDTPCQDRQHRRRLSAFAAFGASSFASGEVHRPKTRTVIRLCRSASVGLDKTQAEFLPTSVLSG